MLVRIISTLAIAVGVTACGPGSPAEESAQTVEAAAPETAVDDPAAPPPAEPVSIDPAHLITANSLGPFRADMTIGEFRAAAGETDLDFEPYFMVDLSALCTVGDAVPSVCAVVYMTEELSDDETIAYLTSADVRFRTADGIGPGVPLAEAEAILGPATLFFSYANESREFVRFADAPESWLSVPSSGEVEQFAGFYDLSSGAEYFETSQYRPGTLIDSIDVYRPWEE